MNSLKFKSSRLALAVLAAGVVGGAGVTAVRGFSTPVFAQQPAVVATAAAPGPIGVVTAPDFATIAAREGPGRRWRADGYAGIFRSNQPMAGAEHAQTAIQMIVLWKAG